MKANVPRKNHQLPFVCHPSHPGRRQEGSEHSDGIRKSPAESAGSQQRGGRQLRFRQQVARCSLPAIELRAKEHTHGSNTLLLQPLVRTSNFAPFTCPLSFLFALLVRGALEMKTGDEKLIKNMTVGKILENSMDPPVPALISRLRTPQF